MPVEGIHMFLLHVWTKNLQFIFREFIIEFKDAGTIFLIDGGITFCKSMLQLKHKITNQGVLNLGIGNNRVTVPGGFGALAKERFDRDILMQSGVKKVIIFEGINDIGAAKSGNSETVARQIIESIQGMMRKAKARKMKVYLGTITPFKGAGYYSHFHEAARLYVNDWIRSQAKKADGILDFAKLLQDPNDDRRMKREYASSDWLHPNPAGYKAMGIYAADIAVSYCNFMRYKPLAFRNPEASGFSIPVKSVNISIWSLVLPRLRIVSRNA